MVLPLKNVNGISSGWLDMNGMVLSIWHFLYNFLIELDTKYEIVVFLMVHVLVLRKFLNPLRMLK